MQPRLKQPRGADRGGRRVEFGRVGVPRRPPSIPHKRLRGSGGSVRIGNSCGRRGWPGVCSPRRRRSLGPMQRLRARLSACARGEGANRGAGGRLVVANWHHLHRNSGTRQDGDRREHGVATVQQRVPTGLLALAQRGNGRAQLVHLRKHPGFAGPMTPQRQCSPHPRLTRSRDSCSRSDIAAMERCSSVTRLEKSSCPTRDCAAGWMGHTCITGDDAIQSGIRASRSVRPSMPRLVNSPEHAPGRPAVANSTPARVSAPSTAANDIGAEVWRPGNSALAASGRQANR